MTPVHTCVDLLKHIEKNYANPKAFNWRENNQWHSISSQEFVNSVKNLALGLHDLGLQRGEKVGILAYSSPQWAMADLAIMMAGGVSVPLFASISDENFLFEVKQTDIKLMFVGGEDQWATFRRHEKLFNKAISMDGSTSHSKSISLKDLMERGKQLNKLQPHLLYQLTEMIKPSDLAIIIYTSGSTGMPKGVELTQENICCVLHYDPYQWDRNQDCYLSVLPLEHVFGHSINLWMMLWGISIYYTNDYKNLGTISNEVKPTTIVVVPRLLEKVYARMVDKIHNAHGLKKILGKFAFKLAREEKNSIIKTLLKPLLDKLVYSKLRGALGGRLRVVICGGAALDPHLHHFFHEIGIPIYVGWGMTEACPVTVNIPSNNAIGTSGPLITPHKLRITSEGEILVQGPLVMRGYYLNPAETAKAIDSQKWLHTGDRGVIDKEGRLKILGRMKELYKTSTGEYVAPVPIEQAICRCPLIESAMVVADGRKFASCLLFPNHETLERLKSEHYPHELSKEAFLQSDFVRTEIDKLLESVNKHLNHWEQIHAYRFVLKPLTIQDGELTPSMKIRREAVAKKYSQLIDAMYPQEAP